MEGSAIIPAPQRGGLSTDAANGSLAAIVREWVDELEAGQDWAKEDMLNVAGNIGSAAGRSYGKGSVWGLCDRGEYTLFDQISHQHLV